MKDYNEIKDIIVNKLGLRDQLTYKAYIDQFHRWTDPRIPTEEEVELLSPDAIDNHAFWKISEELFQTDPVANCQYGTPASIAEANRRNMAIYHVRGFTGLFASIQIMGWWPKARVLEIGPGYGAFKEWIGVAIPEYTYWGADCHPKVDGVDKTLPTGRLADCTKARVYDVVIASNVFQHLSVSQRRDYYRDISGCLSHCGLFMVSMMVDRWGTFPKNRDAKGRIWCKHYGQFTEIQTQDAIYEDLRQFFDIEVVSLVQDGQVVFTCRRRAPVELPKFPV